MDWCWEKGEKKTRKMDQYHDFANVEGDVKKFKSMLNFVFMFGKQE